MATAQASTAPQPRMGRIRAGWELTKGSWRAFKLDKELAWLQVLGGGLVLVSLLVLGILGTLAGIALFGSNGIVPESASWAKTAASIVGLLILTFVLLFIQNVFEGAIIYGITQRFNGGDPTVSTSFAGSWKRWRPLALFSMMMATIGVILQILEEKLPVAGVIATRLVGAAWELANFFAVPIIVLSNEKVSPLGATRQSVGIIKKVWGEGIVMQLSVGLIGFFVIFGYLLITGGATFAAGAAGIVPVAIGFGAVAVIGFVVLGLLFATFSAIVKAALYHYAVTGKSPDLFSKDLLSQTVRPKRRQK